MAQVEFTQQFQVAYTSGTPFYVQLQTTAGVYIVKSLTCHSTVGIASTGSQSLAVMSATSNVGAGLKYLYATDATVASNVNIPVFSPAQQVILTQGYLGFLAVSPSSGNMIIQISYSFIPTANALDVNFSSSYYTVLAPATGAVFTGLSATIPTILKSIAITNPINTASITVTPLLTTATTSNLAFDSATTIAAGSSYTYTLPLYLTSADTVSIASSGSSTFYVLYSYTQDLA